MQKILVIGAGIGGLTTAAYLARRGFAVTVLEAHIYPGGCAGTFYHQGYQFDAGATLAGGFFRGGPMDLVGKWTGIERWPVHPSDPKVMTIHMPDGAEIIRWGDEQRWAEHRAAFGRESLRFWQWQEQTASAMWDLAQRLPPWPIASLNDLLRAATAGAGWLGDGLPLTAIPGLLNAAASPVSAYLQNAPENLRLFVDGQLLISSQAESRQANALYGAAALDLPRRGVVHPKGGMGSIARRLAQAVTDNGGTVLYRQEAIRLHMRGGRPTAVETKRGLFDADLVVANLPPWNIARLISGELPPSLKNLPSRPAGWGAFTLYLGLDESVLPGSAPLHHQIIRGRPLGEGNSVFLSLSPAWDKTRAPAGHRAATLSTHTSFSEWWELHEKDPAAYEARKQEYIEKLLSTAERALPRLREAVLFKMPGTPVSFQRFTRRAFGWVGGFPQVSLFKSLSPRLAPHLWMVGDSIFPGQSTAAAALGGLRAAREIEHSLHPAGRQAKRDVTAEAFDR